jgi:CMP-N-acetylneuraminate monooxygenase
MSSNTPVPRTPETPGHPWSDLGPEAAFTKLPARITVANRSYYLTRGEAGYRLLSTVCPHKGGEIVDVEECLECPHHGWRFEASSGECLNVPNQRLSSFPVIARDGRLFSELPIPSVAPPRVMKQLKHPDELSLRLHAHACLEINYQGFSLLTDPWLCGPAFLGAWTQYPPPVVDVTTMRPDAMVISHEHSDHFHEPTLVEFDRSIPIFIPDFPNRRLVERLAVLGFTNVCPMAFGETYQVSPNMQLTCYEPGGFWNDAILLIEIDGFRLLNLNDAGLNRRVAALVAPVDVVASSFSPAASGYPLCWNHLSLAEQSKILDQACQGKLQMLTEAMALYGGQYLLPFASHFALWHPSHRKYVPMMLGNTLVDIVRAFADSEVQLVDLLPGEKWDIGSGLITRQWRSRERLYDPTRLLRSLERRFDVRQFSACHPTTVDLSRDEVEAYLLGLNAIPEVIFCEDLVVRMQATGSEPTGDDLDVWFEVREGRVRILEEPADLANLTVEIPAGILQLIVREAVSWDEAHIGYWCRFSRTPDLYHAGFWRLIQAPYYKKPLDLPPVDHHPVTTNSVVADLSEKYGAQADRILRRYGLYCAGCSRATYDSLALAGKQHGIEETQILRLVRELNQVFQTNSD